MTWAVVARKDFRDAIRSKVLWLLTALFVIFTAGFAYLYTIVLNMGIVPSASGLTVDGLIAFLLAAVTLLIPLTGLVVGYKAIAGEVESGKAKILLSLPHTRRDVVLGKVVGRATVLAVPIALGFVAAAVVVLALYDSFAPVDFVLFALLTVVFGALFVSVAVAVSASTRSTGVATAGVVSVFVLFQILWDLIPQGISYLLSGSFFPGSPVPGWFLFLRAVRPQRAYETVAMGTLIDGGQSGTDSAFTTPEFAAVVLAFWITVPLLLGYLRFRGRDV